VDTKVKTSGIPVLYFKFLEAKFIEDCNSANRAKMKNGNAPDGSKLSEEDESEMLEFKQNIKLVLSTLGFTFHEVEKVDEKTHEKYFLKTKGIEAKGLYTSEGLILLEGSQVKKEEVKSIQSYLHNLRAEKIEELAIFDKGDCYEVAQKIAFSSVSTAAGFVLGRAANGWLKWKNSEGITIDKVERNNFEK
jgi:hypothetical protein